MSPANADRPLRRHTKNKARAFRICCALLPLSIALVACDSKLDVDAPAPAMTADTDTLPALPSSTLDIPLTYDLSPVVKALEKSVPRKFGDIDKRIQLSNKRMRIAFEATREPFTVSLDGQTANISAVIHYQGKGWYDARFGPEVSGSCGIGQERPRARIQIATNLRITPEWKLRGRTRVGNVKPYSEQRRDQCKVTVFNIDVTGRVVSAARDAIKDKQSFIDGKIASLDVRTRFESWWKLLQRPIPLTDSVWLLINPSAVRMGETVGVKRTLVTALGFSASPRVVTGPRPRDSATALPPLYPAAVGDGLHILLEGVLDYDLATGLLAKQLRGKKVQRAGQTLEVEDVRLFGIGGGKLALELRFKGASKGHIYFVGTPRYDAGTNELFVPDLDYDVGSANLLVSGFEWVKHDDVREFFRRQARWSVGNIMQQGRQQLANGLNRELAPGVKLTAEVKNVQGLAVSAQRKAIRLRAQADATARLTVKHGRS
ncbi:MAG TPA: DUF4403 family protein [Gemmatimonadaceae bacterium]|nr:DUF4403 family protein [Gemmatimonadaceae bacterium]